MKDPRIMPLKRMYAPYLRAVEDQPTRIGALAVIIKAIDLAVRCEFVQERKDREQDPRWQTISKIIARACHSATPAHERESACLMAIRKMEALLPEQYVTFRVDQAKAEHEVKAAKAALKTANQKKPKPAPAAPSKARTKTVAPKIKKIRMICSDCSWDSGYIALGCALRQSRHDIEAADPLALTAVWDLSLPELVAIAQKLGVSPFQQEHEPPVKLSSFTPEQLEKACLSLLRDKPKGDSPIAWIYVEQGCVYDSDFHGIAIPLDQYTRIQWEVTAKVNF